MIRYLLAFLVLFALAAAGIALLPMPPRQRAIASSAAAPLRMEAQAAVPSGVRVVYPAPDATVAPPPAPASAAALPVTPADPPKAEDAPEIAVAPPPGDATQAAVSAVNLNTASIEALNEIPGGGRIGRTIASHRPYRSVEELLTKRVVRKSVFDQIKDHVAAK